MSDILGHAQSQDDTAVALLIEFGLLSTCPIHDDSVIAGHTDDLEAVYKAASSRLKNGDPDLNRLFSSQKELTDAIKEAYEVRNEDECGSCNSAGNA